MFTIQEYMDKYKGSKGIDTNGPITLWFHATDLMEHILNFKQGNTIFPTTSTRYQKYIDIVREEIDRDRDDFETFDEMFENSYLKKKKYKPEMSDSEGELDIEAYIAKEKKLFERYVEVVKETKSAISIFINFGLNYHERRNRDVKEAYEQVYQIAATCEAEDRPCRVIGCYALRAETYNNVIKIPILLKDYNDPIFPSIWAGICNNTVAHALCCLIPTYLVGSRDPFIGQAVTFDISDLCESDEEIITFGNKIRHNN